MPHDSASASPVTRRGIRREIRRQGRRQSSRRWRALLASGLVLGIGSVMTLAAWTDEEYARGTVSAGSFSLEGSTDGRSYRASSTENPHTLNFSLTTRMLPGNHTFALLSVRTTSGSTPGTLQLQASSSNTGGLNSHLRYGVRQISGTTCNAGSYDAGSQVVGNGSTLTTSPSSQQNAPADAGGTVNYCLRLSLPADAPNAAQGQQSSPSWTVQGTSVNE